MKLIEASLNIALRAYAGKVDKAGREYILHPLRVMAKMKTDEEMSAALLHDVLEDSEITAEQLLAEGDLVVARTSARGTHTGSLFGVAPTGRVVTQANIAIYRLVEGQIVERWSHHPISILEQIGAREDAVTP